MKCPSCSHVNRDIATFCSKCGESITTEPAKEEVPTPAGNHSIQSWIKHNPILILSAFVILLVLFSGYQSYQISELHASTEILDKELSSLTSAYNSHRSLSSNKMAETNKKLDSLISAYNAYRRAAADELNALDRKLSNSISNVSGSLREHSSGWGNRHHSHSQW